MNEIVIPHAALAVNSITGNADDQINAAYRGDFNGDGYLDVVACSDYTDSSRGGLGYGGVFIFFGVRGTSAVSGTVSTSTADVTLDGETPNDFYSGISCAVGDVNNDGIDDIIIGAPHNTNGGTRAGAVYVVAGSSALASSSLSTALEFTGEVANDHAGTVVATGDVNGDGIGDIIVGAAGNGDGGTAAGAVYVVLGSATLASSSLSTAIELMGQAWDYASNSSLATGDMNNDGIDDIIIGAISNDGGGVVDAGAVYVVLGKSTWSRSTYSLTPGITIRKFNGKASIDYLGSFVGYFSSVSTTPLTSPIPAKLVIGASLNDDGATDAGQIWLIGTLPGRAAGYQRTVP